ncbi:MAG TPA: cupin domain-containing protein [Vicinamibacterales bacterium]|nr:cupin domain-containing protein [Vicinamibacterales bacterium]
MNLRLRIAFAFLVLILADGPLQSSGLEQISRPTGVIVVKPAEVKWTDYPNRPGVKLAVIEGDLGKAGPFLIRVKFPAGYKLAPHTHPNVEHTTVLSGTMRLGYGTDAAGASEAFGVGTVVITPANTPHFFSTATETIVQTHGVGPWGSTPAK